MAIQNLKEKFEEMSALLQGKNNICILCHDNPDPDSLAGMFALRYLLHMHFKVSSRLLFGGVIGRAENRAMVNHLGIPVRSLEQARLKKDTWFVLVDTQPSAKNHSLPEGGRVLMVFDHHPPKRPLRSQFTHIDDSLGATSTLILGYLREASLEPDWRLSTALAYAIISETQDLGRESSREDIQAYLYALPRARLKTLSLIKNPPLPQDYFQVLQKALNNTFYYRNIVVTRLGRVQTSDMIHQMADLFLKFERRSWSLCIGWTDEYILMSLRSSDVRARCGQMIRKLVRGKGSAGGHEMMAGGRIPCAGIAEKEIKKIEELVIFRFMRQFRHDKGPKLLVPIIEIESEETEPGHEGPL